MSNISNLKGSPKRDTFKHAHKTAGKMKSAGFIASDLDLILIDKDIIAILDYKSSVDSVTETEKILYDVLGKLWPIYIVTGDSPDCGPFVITKYSDKEYVRKVANWDEFFEWELDLRRKHHRNP